MLVTITSEGSQLGDPANFTTRFAEPLIIPKYSKIAVKSVDLYRPIRLDIPTQAQITLSVDSQVTPCFIEPETFYGVDGFSDLAQKVESTLNNGLQTLGITTLAFNCDFNLIDGVFSIQGSFTSPHEVDLVFDAIIGETLGMEDYYAGAAESTLAISSSDPIGGNNISLLMLSDSLPIRSFYDKLGYAPILCDPIPDNDGIPKSPYFKFEPQHMTYIRLGNPQQIVLHDFNIRFQYLGGGSVDGALTGITTVVFDVVQD